MALLILASATVTTAAGAAGVQATTGAPGTTGGIESDGSTTLLAESTQASTAVRRVGLSVIQRQNPRLSAAAVRRLIADPTTWVDRSGRLFAVDPPAPAAAEPSTDQSTPLVAEAVVDPVNTSPHAASAAFQLQSKPGSARVLYLDFDGATVTGTAWSSGTIVAGAFDVDDDPATFNERERAFIEDVWLRVAEDYAPFDVNVTTQDPGIDAITRSNANDQQYGTRALISMGDSIGASCGCGGIAYIGVFDEPNSHAHYQPAWVFPQSLSMDSKSVAEAVSHEVGHNLGLEHDGRTNGEGYYAGQGAWAPIMGVGYYKPVTQFSAGAYPSANNTQDDLQVIQNHGLALRADDHGNTAGTATALPGASFDTEGIIERSTDVDVFSVTVGAGPLNVYAYASAVGPNVDLQVRVLNGSGTEVAISDPAVAMATTDLATGLSASVSPNVGAGTYTIWVKGVGAGDGATGYPAYGSLGHYRLSSSAPTLNVSVDGAAGPTIVSDPAGINCPSTCSSTFALDAQVSVETEGPLGTAFAGWAGARCSSYCTVVMSAPRTLRANWTALQPVNLTVTKSGAGSGSVVSSPGGITCGATCSAAYFPGQSVELTATPGSGSVVASWSVPECFGTTCSVTMSAARTVTVTFAVARTLSVTVSGAYGVVQDNTIGYSCADSCTDDFADGTVVSLTPQGFGSSIFSGWTGACSGTTVPCSVQMTQARSVGATFVDGEVLYLGVESPEGGSLSTGVGSVTVQPGGATCADQYCQLAFLPGTVVTLTRASGPRGAFAAWTGACTGSGAQCQVTMSTTRFVTATFDELNRRELSVSVSGTGSVTSQPAGINCPGTCDGYFDDGTVVTLTATAGTGATFSDWYADTCSGTGTCTVTLTYDQSVSAYFDPKYYSLSVTKSGAGSGTVTAAPGPLACGATCAWSYQYGTQVTLTPTPQTGSSFAGWSGACTGTGACSVTINQARAVGARFDKNQMTLSVAKGGPGTGTVTSSPSGINCGLTCSKGFDVGTDVWLTAAPAAGSTFASWSGACAQVSNNQCKVSLSSAAAVTANFGALPPAAVTAVPGNRLAVLSWSNVSASGSGVITDYVIQRSKNNAAWTTLRDGKNTKTTYTAKLLTNGASYRFRVAAVKATGQGPWVEAAAVVPRTTPSAPRSLVLVAGNHQIALTWKAPSSTGGATVTDYVVEYSTTGVTWTTFPDGASTATGAVITGLTPGISYRVRVAAVNVAGTGTRTGVKRSTPKAS